MQDFDYGVVTGGAVPCPDCAECEARGRNWHSYSTNSCRVCKARMIARWPRVHFEKWKTATTPADFLELIQAQRELDQKAGVRA